MKKPRITVLIACLTLADIIVYSQPVTLNQVKDNTFIIEFQNSAAQHEISMSNYPDSWKDPVKISIKEDKDTFNLVSVHPLIKSQVNGKNYYCSQRLIVLKGAINFRDLGGYINKEGKQVKWGKIYRSADISKLTDDDLKVITALHINLDCDLRGDKEVDAAPDKIPAGVERISLPAGSENVGMNDYMKYMKDSVTADSMMLTFYTKTDHFQKKYKPMFDRLLTLGTDDAVLFHCSAGKDRTGVGAALILYALGVEESVIFQDYALTNTYRKALNDQSVMGLMMRGIPANASMRFMVADPRYLKATFDTLKKQYGSVDAFLESVMGLNNINLNLLKSKFLY